jgi:hypothetical protein
MTAPELISQVRVLAPLEDWDNPLAISLLGVTFICVLRLERYPAFLSTVAPPNSGPWCQRLYAPLAWGNCKYENESQLAETSISPGANAQVVFPAASGKLLRGSLTRLLGARRL